MCMGTVFLCCYPIRTGVVILSTFMLTLGFVGTLFHPLMPYSGQDMSTFALVQTYTVFLMIAFFLTLIGLLSRKILLLFFGWLLGWLLFILWVYLALEGLSNNFCFGLRCAETHWLVPREFAHNQEAEEERIVPLSKYKKFERKDEMDLSWVDPKKLGIHGLHPAGRAFKGRGKVEDQLAKKAKKIQDQERIKTVEAEIEKLNSAKISKLSPEEKMKLIEEKLNSMHNIPTPDGSGVDDKIARIEEQINNMEAGNSQERMRLIQERLNLMHNIPTPDGSGVDPRIARIEGQINNMETDSSHEKIRLIQERLESILDILKPEVDPRIAQIEEEIDNMEAKSLQGRMRLIKEKLNSSQDIPVPDASGLDPLIARIEKQINNMDKLKETTDHLGGQKPRDFNIQNFQEIYKYKCYRRDNGQGPNPASYIITAFQLRYQKEFATGLAIIYGALFLCALLTICTELILYHVKSLENQMCCGVGKWATKNREWEQRRDLEMNEFSDSDSMEDAEYYYGMRDSDDTLDSCDSNYYY